jgi:nucleoside 2-deoxyribosyltransferase
MISKGLIYLAGPISGLSYDEAAKGWREEFKEKLYLYTMVRCISPMRGKSHLNKVETIAPAGQYSETVMSSAKGIVGRDRFDVNRVDLMVANLLGATRVSIGTMVEYGWADAARVPIITIIEPDGTNPHHHDFIYELSSFTVHNLDEAVAVVMSVLGDDL